MEGNALAALGGRRLRERAVQFDQRDVAGDASRVED